MATFITEECINCGACEPECPNEAISEGEDIYVIDPNLCTECVGFHSYEACQAVCPVECCIPDPNNREMERTLYQRAVLLHPELEFPSYLDLPGNLSRFRGGGGSSDLWPRPRPVSPLSLEMPADGRLARQDMPSAGREDMGPASSPRRQPMEPTDGEIVQSMPPVDGPGTKRSM